VATPSPPITNKIRLVPQNGYTPFGKTKTLTDGHTRNLYIGKEVDTESSLADHGVRKYDPAFGRFTCPDVLWEKYAGCSPYHYTMNNPVGFVYGNGYELQALDEESQQDIKNTLPKNIRDNVVFNEDGVLDAQKLNEVYSDDINYIALLAMALLDQLVIVENRDKFIYYYTKDATEIESFEPGAAYKGMACFPDDKGGKFYSVYPNAIHIQINRSNTDEKSAEFLAEEYMHTFFDIVGWWPLHQRVNDIDTNYKLKYAIKKHRKQAVENYNDK
jgi:RHS repeat-associated protein